MTSSADSRSSHPSQLGDVFCPINMLLHTVDYMKVGLMSVVEHRKAAIEGLLKFRASVFVQFDLELPANWWDKKVACIESGALDSHVYTFQIQLREYKPRLCNIAFSHSSYLRSLVGHTESFNASV
jgi:hypothetical protein